MGLVNTVVPLADLEAETVEWCREMLRCRPSPCGSSRLVPRRRGRLRRIQQLAHDANLLFYGREEAQEGREAFKAKRRPDFERFPRRP